MSESNPYWLKWDFQNENTKFTPDVNKKILKELNNLYDDNYNLDADALQALGVDGSVEEERFE